ncbi:MAG: hypothetical protein K0Q79_3162 [Flavipsychrobacter sp.]|jgi:ELWxxDGT repeat protein|nr:hypothetical protein [Flavipsychrobacter sp.]
MRQSIIFSFFIIACAFTAGAQVPYLVKDINTGTGNSSPGRMADLNGTLLLRADDGVNGSELWKTDGTLAGTVLVKDINPGSPGSNIGTPSIFDSMLFFKADNGTNGSELWVSDGTAAGTFMLLDINTGSGSSNPDNFEVVGGALFFTATNGTNGIELWKTDGTMAGTVMVKDINPGSAASAPSNLSKVATFLLFTATDGTNGTELWKSDGTPGGTVMVKDINPGATGSLPTLAYPQIVSNDTLYFFADDGTNGIEPWISDGTASGTFLLKDINPGSSSSKTSTAAGIYFTEIGGNVFFSAMDATNGEELWKTDGTGAGTVLVKDINPGSASGCSGTSWFAMLSLLPVSTDTFYFTANNGVDGYEVWMSDGTATGTFQVKDVNPGAPASCGLIGLFMKHNNIIYFVATTAANGYELWRTDGSAAGTTMIADINAGTADGVAFTFGFLTNKLFFEGNDGTTGRELWALGLPTPTSIQENAFHVADATIVYPNPSGGVFSFRSQTKLSTIEITNLTGQKIYSAAVNSEKAEIDLRNQPKGIYFYQLQGDNGVLSNGKIIVE